MTSDFLSLISLGWVVTFQDSHRTVFTFRSWLDLLGVVLAFWIAILKISKLLQNCWHRVIDITSFEKHLESSLDHTLDFCRNLVIFRSKNICQKESLTGLLRWSSLQTKEGQRNTEFLLVGFENSQTPSTTTVWPSDHREDYRSCAWPFYSLVQTFPKAYMSSWKSSKEGDLPLCILQKGRFYVKPFRDINFVYQH